MFLVVDESRVCRTEANVCAIGFRRMMGLSIRFDGGQDGVVR